MNDCTEESFDSVLIEAVSMGDEAAIVRRIVELAMREQSLAHEEGDAAEVRRIVEQVMEP